MVNSGDIRIACEMQPNRLSMLSSKRKLGLFWIDDVDQFPWFEQCRPLRNIIHWWAAERRYYIVHAACVGYNDKCVLVIGDAGSGKSTTSMSSLDSDMLFCSDDLCLIGIENGMPHAYNLFNTGKLENFDRLPQLEKYVWNTVRSPEEKAVVFVHKNFPDKLLLSAPISAIVMPSVTANTHSVLEPAENRHILRAFAKSTAVEIIGAGPQDFLGVFKICSSVPCFKLKAGSNLTELNAAISGLLLDRQQAMAKT